MRHMHQLYLPYDTPAGSVELLKTKPEMALLFSRELKLLTSVVGDGCHDKSTDGEAQVAALYTLEITGSNATGA